VVQLDNLVCLLQLWCQTSHLLMTSTSFYYERKRKVSRLGTRPRGFRSDTFFGSELCGPPSPPGIWCALLSSCMCSVALKIYKALVLLDTGKRLQSNELAGPGCTALCAGWWTCQQNIIWSWKETEGNKRTPDDSFKCWFRCDPKINK